MITSWASATIAATDIFHSRKYAQMKSTTRIRKTIRPVIERLATSLPQLAPISSWEMSSVGSTSIVSARTFTTSSESAVASCLVWTMMLRSPEVVTTGDAAPSMPVPATAWRSASASSWVTLGSPSATVTRYCAPPTNSMPMLRPLKYRPATASRTITPDMAYQSHLRPTKSIDFLPV